MNTQIKSDEKEHVCKFEYQQRIYGPAYLVCKCGKVKT
jgi:hypothetical protein